MSVRDLEELHVGYLLALAALALAALALALLVAFVRTLFPGLPWPTPWFP